MPKTPVNYQNTIIYKIVCMDLNIIDSYVGNTTNFIKRKHNHQFSCNNITDKAYNYYVYEFIRNNGGWNNWSMIEVEKYPCNDRNEALKRERYWLEELKSTLNIVKPTRTKLEWYADNKDIVLKQHKEYYETNKEVMLEQQKKYYEENKEIIIDKQKDYYKANKEKKIQYQKGYAIENREKILEQKRQYRENNREKIRERDRLRRLAKKNNIK
jgi:hypothetical protein